MKILEIVADGNPGGGTTFVLDILKTLDNPALLVQKKSYAFEKAGKIAKYGIDFFTSRFDLRISMNMQKVINEVSPELIHVNGGRAAFFLSFCRKSCPVLYTVHGLHGIYQNLKFSRFGERRAMQKATFVNFVSKTEEDLAIKNNLLGKTRHSVIAHGIDLNILPPPKNKIPKLIGFMGRLCDVKDPLFLLKVMEFLGPKGYRLRVIGGGEYAETMKSNPYTAITGEVSREEGLKLLSEVETIVIPSKWEAFGLILLESMGLEIPIIASRIPSFEEILRNGTFATLIAEKDPEKYATAILQRPDYSREAKKHLTENFSWNRCVQSYHSIFRELKEKSCYPLK